MNREMLGVAGVELATREGEATGGFQGGLQLLRISERYCTAKVTKLKPNTTISGNLRWTAKQISS
jgi:hypothetical protein